MVLLINFGSGIAYGLGFLTGILIGAGMLIWFLWHRLKHGVAAEDAVIDGALVSTRITLITVLAERVFGDTEKAKRWLNKPKNLLDGLTPVQAVATEEGMAQVEEMLVRIEEGMAS